MQGQLTEARAKLLAAAGEEAVLLALSAANARIAALRQPVAPSPSTPSGMVPVYQKRPKKSLLRK